MEKKIGKNPFSHFYFLQFSFKSVLNGSGRNVEKRDQKIVVLGVEDGEFVSVSEPIFGLQISSGKGAIALRARHPDTTKNSIFEWQVYRSAGRYVEKNTEKNCFFGKNHWKKSGLFLPKNFANFFRKTCFANVLQTLLLCDKKN